MTANLAWINKFLFTIQELALNLQRFVIQMRSVSTASVSNYSKIKSTKTTKHALLTLSVEP